jgi:uncharacterized membrane protein required for colicin V production
MKRSADIAPLSTERKKRAEGLLTRAQSFSALRADDDADIGQEPSGFDETRTFEPFIDKYFNYHIDYYPRFDRPGSPLDPLDWTYFADINDEITEQKFERDQDIRAFITAFRFTIERNRLGIIALKRVIQTVVVLVIFAAAISFAWQSNLPYGHSVMLGLAAAALFAAVAGGFYQNIRGSQLQSVVDANGKTLANAIQERVNNLNKNFTEFLADIDREEASEDMTDPEWTRRSAWWMQLSMWVPKRIEYIEKFLQSEMQRVRVFMLRSTLTGYASAVGVLSSIALVAGVLLWLDPLHASTPALSWSAWAGGCLAAVLFTLYSLRSSMKLTDISAALGREPLGKSSRFADIDLHKKLSEQVRRDKEKLRQHLLAGGYAQNRPTRRG